METTMQKFGRWAWIIGICLAVVLGVVTTAAQSQVIQAILVILGVIVGIINVRGDEAKDFLFAASALLLASYFGAAAFNLNIFNGSIDAVMSALQFFVAPMTIIVAIKAIYAVAKDQ